MNTNFKCSQCGEMHDGPPLSYGRPAPDLACQIPEDEFERRVDLTSDQCVIDDKYFFVLGRIEIPILDSVETFAWLAWVSLSKENFLRACDLWETPGRENEDPYFGWLQSSLPCYGRFPVEVATRVHTRPVGERPYIELEPTDFQLAYEQRNGITFARVMEIAEKCIHQIDR